MNQTVWNIGVVNPTDTVLFAAEEFARLVRKMDPAAEATITTAAYVPGSNVLWIGLDENMPTPPAVEDPAVDDSLYIQVENCSGVITGSNERSVLLAVYRFFRECGCAFLKPGQLGEFVPAQDSRLLKVSLSETPAYRHRGICLEGSNCYENVTDMIDFAPKLGFNAYFTQLFRPSFAFRRWYEHHNNPELVGEELKNEAVDAFVADYHKEITKRGLLHHRIGHGWASKVLGITSTAWHELNDESEVLPECRDLVAFMGGQRKLYKGSGIDTNLCYSDERVQKLLADEVVAYAKENPDTRYLHFWLADQLNNQCECERCQQKRPADFYVQMLNRMDAALTAAGLDTKIVFLIYLDLLWEPETERIQNPDRFVMMFAPIRRSYSVPMASDTGRKQIPYKRNGFQNPMEAGGALPYLKAWQQQFKGDSFIFDYHYMWDYINDPGCYQSLEIMAKDVEDFRSLGLNGFMSCQNQRVFMPYGLGMQVIADTLWTGKEDFAAQLEQYCRAAYGNDWALCAQYLQKLSGLLDPVVLRGERPVRDEALAEQFASVETAVAAFAPVIEQNICSVSGVQKRFWECLDFHGRLCVQIARVLIKAAEGDIAAMDASWDAVKDFVRKNEMQFQKEFDVFEFLLVWESKTLPRFRQQAESFIE